MFVACPQARLYMYAQSLKNKALYPNIKLLSGSPSEINGQVQKRFTGPVVAGCKVGAALVEAGAFVVGAGVELCSAPQ